MEEKVLSAAEAAEFLEFQRCKREKEISLNLGKLLVDASRREADKKLISSRMEELKRWHGWGIVLSPVHIGVCNGRPERAVCTVGGSGETVIPVKVREAKYAVREGASEIRLTPCYSAMVGGNYPYLRKELKKVKRACRKIPITLMLDDPVVTLDMVSGFCKMCADLAVERVCVRGETQLVSGAMEGGLGKVEVDVSGVQNAEQLRILFQAGASRGVCNEIGRIAEELYRNMEAELGQS